MMIAAPAYFDLLGLELVEGRFFSDSLDEPSQQKVVINESALNYWNITDLDQQKLKSNTSGRSEFDFDIIGVVKDYHYQHMAFDIKPLILRYRSYDDDPFLIRFKPGQASAGLASLEELFTEINPKGTFEYESLQERLATQYGEEKKLAKIYLLFAVVALLLSSISLFTFSFYEAKRRTKEIGVRKVIGASTAEIFSLLSKSFGKTIIIAYLLTTPVAYYFQSQWMTQFENQARIEWWVYAGTGAMIFFAALSVTGYHTWQVARQNPVKALRYE